MPIGDIGAKRIRDYPELYKKNDKRNVKQYKTNNAIKNGSYLHVIVGVRIRNKAPFVAKCVAILVTKGKSREASIFDRRS